MGIVDEFAKYGARLTNPQWAVSAEAGGQIVMSLWQHRITVEGGGWIYRDQLSRWSGNGNRLFARHLQKAIAENLDLRIVLVRTDDIALVESGADASKCRKVFKARPDWVGRVTAFDGDAFVLTFQRRKAG